MRPILFLLAGVDGAGKSSALARALTRRGLPWFDPDAQARSILEGGQQAPVPANAIARAHGRRLFADALAGGHNHVLETTLATSDVPAMVLEASATHDVHLWYCGLERVELHIERARDRASAGGHDADPAGIRAQWRQAPRTLITLMPALTALRVYDNSRAAAAGGPFAEPELLIDVRRHVVLRPGANDLGALEALPAWAHPIAEAAFAADPR